jgi:hypothetical protein
LYYVQVTANSSPGYLASAASAQANGHDTSQVGVPGNPTVAAGFGTGSLVVTFTAPSGTAPLSYNVEACTDAAMTANCVTKNNYTSGAQFTGLASFTRYYVQITAVAPTGYVANAWVSGYRTRTN